MATELPISASWIETQHRACDEFRHPFPQAPEPVQVAEYIGQLLETPEPVLAGLSGVAQHLCGGHAQASQLAAFRRNHWRIEQ